jgi:hypothetical protein
MRYESTDWSLEVPEGWRHEQDGRCTTFISPVGIGAFQVSSYRKEHPVSDDDLRGFAGAIPLAAVTVGRLSGFCARFSEHDTSWTKWWLRAGHQMIHVTYNCPVSECGREEVELTAMLQSLTPEYEVQEV